LTYEQLENIFPEFRDRLELYDKCCDGTGKIVRNLDFYKAYKSKPHSVGKRGSKQDKIQLLNKRLYKGSKKIDKKEEKKEEFPRLGDDEDAEKKGETSASGGKKGKIDA